MTTARLAAPSSSGSDEFGIPECYRFESASDPADETLVYGVQASNGLKDLLVNGYGIYSARPSSEIEQKRHFYLEI
ncbi:hypothetical protein GCM10023188_02470 [Pontibacter saemangeumensis]|uniref:Uncharacterized protein n=1 Tax=Pontibacter saemangeumensis TaxID=1084525 RepID=A0ABP8L843_9BACT